MTTTTTTATATSTTRLLPAALPAALAALALAALAALCCCGKGGGGGGGAKTVVASFYPMYIAALNVADGAKGVRVVNMAAQSAGCLHDYGLTPADAALLERASALIINGGGAEAFLDKAAAANEKLAVIYASEHVDFILAGGGSDTAAYDLGSDSQFAYVGDSLPLPSDEIRDSAAYSDENYHAHHQAHDIEVNIHAWMSLSNHIRQIETIAERLSAWDTANAAVYAKNAKRYTAALAGLRESAARDLSGAKSRKIAVSHDGFVYLANEFGLTVTAVIEKSSGAAPSAAEIISAVNAVRADGPKAIFTELSRPSPPAKTVAAETGLPVFELDMAVSGSGEKDSYIRAMENNVATLKKALE
ncbi:MAG: metal ABC transporter substrate-binding protein [Chitinispirillales bacterium]|jgi:zinc transport system substrate-binding protein|nr:metal ABC transporter substrate-binding protein [Chitinispirillales bacterium]